MARTLITGGCGFVGSNLVRAIVERDRTDQLVVFDDESMGSPRDLPDIGLDYHKGDIRDPAALARAAAGCDTIIHLAANTRVIESIEDPRLNFEVNVRGTFDVLMAARGRREAGRHGVNWAMSSRRCTREWYRSRPHPTALPSSLARAMAMPLPDPTACRSRLYASRTSMGRGPIGRAARSRISSSRSTIDSPSPSTGTAARSGISSLAPNSARASSRPSMPRCPASSSSGRSGKPTTINELLAAMKQVVGPDRWPEVRYAGWRAGEVRRTYCDISRARRAFGFEPATVLPRSLDST